MESKRCFLIGHRSVPESIRPHLCNAIEQHITTYGVEEFYVGRYGQFDRMVVQALVDAKAIFPHIRLYLLTPYHPSERPVSLPAGFDASHPGNTREILDYAQNRALKGSMHILNLADFIENTAQYCDPPKQRL